MAKDDDDQDPTVDDPQDDDEDDDQDDEEFKAPKTQAELDLLIKAAGSAEAKKWRLRAQGRDPKWKPEAKTDPPVKKDAPTAKDGDTKTEAEIEADVRAKLQGEYDALAKKDSLRGSVAAAIAPNLNLSDDEAKSASAARKAVNRVVAMIELDNLTLEDDGSIDGLDDEVADLRKAFPGLFKSGTNGRPKTNGGDAGEKRGGTGGKRDPLDELAESFFKGS